MDPVTMSAMPDAATTLIVIPTYNERKNIALLIEHLLGHTTSTDILVVDDGSPDGTAEDVRALHEKYGDRVQLLSRSGKGGRGSAVLAGFHHMLAHNYDLVFEMDADFSHDPDEIPRFLEALPGADAVFGSRYLPGSEIRNWSWKRTIFSRWANRYARFILGLPLTDYTNGYRCYRRSAIEVINFDAIQAKGYVVLSEVADQLFRKGKRIVEVPTLFVNRRRGTSNLSWKEIREAFLSVWRIRRARSKAA